MYGSAQQNPHGCSNCTDATRTADVLPGRIAEKQSTDLEISLQSPQGRSLASSEKKQDFIQNTPTAKAGQQCCGNPPNQNKLKMQEESGRENHGSTTADLPPLSGTSKAARRKASSSGRSQLKRSVGDVSEVVQQSSAHAVSYSQQQSHPPSSSWDPHKNSPAQTAASQNRLSSKFCQDTSIEEAREASACLGASTLLLYLGNAHQSSCPHDTAVGTEGTENEQAMPDVHDCSVQASGTYPVAANGVHPHGLITATEPAADTAATSNSGATTSPRTCKIKKPRRKSRKRQSKGRKKQGSTDWQESQDCLEAGDKHYVKIAVARQFKRFTQRMAGRRLRERQWDLYSRNKARKRQRPINMADTSGSEGAVHAEAPHSIMDKRLFMQCTIQMMQYLANKCNTVGPTAPSPSSTDELRPEVIKQHYYKKHEQRGGGPSKAPAHDKAGRVAETWVSPTDKQLYCEPQRAGYCGIHALNAMAGRQVLTPEQAMHALVKELPRSTDDGQNCREGGWFRIESICKLLYYFIQEDVTLVPVLGNVHHLAQQAPRYTKWEVLENHAPTGCNALYLHKPGGGGHFTCWKKSHVDDKWYELDSIPYGGSRNRGKVKELTDEDWYNFKGTMSTTVKRDAYTSHTTMMNLSRARRLPLESTQNLAYVDLQQVAFTAQVNCSRPASTWTQQDFPNQQYHLPPGETALRPSVAKGRAPRQGKPAFHNEGPPEQTGAQNQKKQSSLATNMKHKPEEQEGVAKTQSKKPTYTGPATKKAHLTLDSGTHQVKRRRLREGGGLELMSKLRSSAAAQTQDIRSFLMAAEPQQPSPATKEHNAGAERVHEKSGSTPMTWLNHTQTGVVTMVPNSTAVKVQTTSAHSRDKPHTVTEQEWQAIQTICKKRQAQEQQRQPGISAAQAHILEQMQATTKAAITGPKGAIDTSVHTDKKLRPAADLHGVEKEVAGTFRAHRAGRRHKGTHCSRTHAAAADWKVGSVCKKGISKQYKKIKQQCAAEITQHPAILADTYTDCEGTNAKMKIVTENGRGIKAKVQLMKKMMEAKPDILVWTEHHLPAIDWQWYKESFRHLTEYSGFCQKFA